MKAFISILLGLLFSAGLIAQFESFQIERHNKKLDVIISDPFISPHWPVGLIYKDISDDAFANLSDYHLRIADGPVGTQVLNKNVLFTEVKKDRFSINRHFNPNGGVVWIGPSQPGYWGPRDSGSFGSQYDFNTWGNIYTINSGGNRLSELTSNSGNGALKLYRYSGGFIYIHTLTINDAGQPVWLAVSDRRTKNDITNSDPVLPKIAQLQLKNYKYKGSNSLSTGFIAQEVQKVFPDLVGEIDGGMLGVNYMGFSPLAIQAIKEQQEIIESLEERIEKLEKIVLEK